MSDLAAQAASLLWTLCTSTALVIVNLPVAVVLCVLRCFPIYKQLEETPGTSTFYEGVVEHERKLPVHHAFRWCPS